jgi:hypothetical protein
MSTFPRPRWGRAVSTFGLLICQRRDRPQNFQFVRRCTPCVISCVGEVQPLRSKMRLRRFSTALASLVQVGLCTEFRGLEAWSQHIFCCYRRRIGRCYRGKAVGCSGSHSLCAAKGQQMVAMQTQSNIRPDFLGDPVGHHDLTFRCG